MGNLTFIFSGPYEKTPSDAIDSLLNAIRRYDPNAEIKKNPRDNNQHAHSISYTHRGKNYVSKVYLTTSWDEKLYYASI